MNLANWSALWWLAVIGPIVGFYILKVRLRRVAVPTMLFWNRLYDEQQPRSIWQRLRNWVSLLVQVALALLIVLALADPYFAWEIRQLRRVVLIVDHSASMNANDVTPSRLAAAKTEAASIIQQLRFRDELAVVAASATPRVVCGFSSHAKTLTAAIEAIPPTDCPTRLSNAVELAQRLLGDRDDERQREIIVLTDRELPVAETTPAVQVRRFGTTSGNIGITQFQVRRSVIDPLSYELLVEVVNASETPEKCRLELELNGDVIDVVPLKLAAGQRWQQAFEKSSADGGQLTAKLNRNDALSADNQAWAILPKQEPIPLSLVAEPNLFLQKVFESNPLVQVTQVEPGAADVPAAVTVFHRSVPQTLPTGSVLVIDPRNDTDLFTVGDAVSNPLVGEQNQKAAETAAGTSLLSHVRLDNVVLPEAREVKFADESIAKVLIRAVSGEPLLATIERPGQKVLLLTVNLDDGDLPLRTAFPILMANALNWFTDNRGELSESLATGTISEIDAATLGAVAPGERLMLVAPDGRRTELPLTTDRVSLGPLDQSGLWRIVVSPPEPTKTERTVAERAVNLANADESDIRCAAHADDDRSPRRASGWLGQRPVWVSLIVLAWGLLAGEWWAYQRRWLA